MRSQCDLQNTPRVCVRVCGVCVRVGGGAREVGVGGRGQVEEAQAYRFHSAASFRPAEERRAQGRR